MGVLNQHLGWQAPGGVLSTTHLYSCCQQRIHHERIQHLQHSFVGEVCEQPPGPGLQGSQCAHLELWRGFLVLCDECLQQVPGTRHPVLLMMICCVIDLSGSFSTSLCLSLARWVQHPQALMYVCW